HTRFSRDWSSDVCSSDLQIIQRYGPAGPRELAGDPARVTDDTQMALAVAWALREVATPTPDALEAELRRRFVAWSTSPDNNRARSEERRVGRHQGTRRGR